MSNAPQSPQKMTSKEKEIAKISDNIFRIFGTVKECPHCRNLVWIYRNVDSDYIHITADWSEAARDMARDAEYILEQVKKIENCTNDALANIREAQRRKKENEQLLKDMGYSLDK